MNSKFDRLALMHKEASAPEAYEDSMRILDEPNKMVTNNSQVFTGNKWTNINRKQCIATGLTIPRHQHQNYCEQVSSNFKFAVLKLFHNTPHTTVSYW